MLVEIFRYATDVVPRHFPFASVFIERTHFRIRFIRLFNQNNPITAYAVMLGTKGNTKGFRASDLAVVVFDKDIVVAARVHFNEGYLLPFFPHRANVDKLGITHVETAFEHIYKRICGIQTC